MCTGAQAPEHMPDRSHQGWFRVQPVLVQGLTDAHLEPALWHCELLAWYAALSKKVLEFAMPAAR